ncbi:MAG: methylated-DNA--[protein]-cysteine S-methyltransferase [Lapillicoccus sp.]
MTSGTTHTTWHTELETGLGPLTAVRDSEGVTGLYFPGHWTRPDPTAWGERRDEGFDDLTAQLEDYLAGTRQDFDVPLHLVGTPFQQEVWSLLRAIPYGTTRSYGEIASEIGTAAAHPRAVGHSVGHNPVSVLVPCHRVVGSTGRLTGYAGGLERKITLLTLEGVLAQGATSVSRSTAPRLW